MVDNKGPVIITAIAESNFESFVSSNLHSQGWDIVARAVDFMSLNSFIAENQGLAKTSVLIYTPDLPGLTSQNLIEIRGQLRQVIGFGTELEQIKEPALRARPTDPAELISEVRGLIRREFREPLISRVSLKNPTGAKIISIGSAGTATGASTLAINLAMESSLLDKRTLLVDANPTEPAISISLELRNLKADLSPRLIAPMLWAYEFTEGKTSQLPQFFENALTNFDLVIIDLGSISNLPAKLADRRWESRALIWCCDNSDEIWLNSRPDQIGRFRLTRLITELTKTKIKAQLQFVANMEVPLRRNDPVAHEIAAAIDQLNPIGRLVLPRDNRAVLAAGAASSALSEGSPKSSLRRAISKIASDL